MLLDAGVAAGTLSSLTLRCFLVLFLRLCLRDCWCVVVAVEVVVVLVDDADQTSLLLLADCFLLTVNENIKAGAQFQLVVKTFSNRRVSKFLTIIQLSKITQKT